jgi:hypothetical protein
VLIEFRKLHRGLTDFLNVKVDTRDPSPGKKKPAAMGSGHFTRSSPACGSEMNSMPRIP